MQMLKSVFTQEVRGWIYRVLLAVGALLAAYGVVSADELAVWIGVIVAILNIMPTANTSVSGKSITPPDSEL